MGWGSTELYAIRLHHSHSCTAKLKPTRKQAQFTLRVPSHTANVTVVRITHPSQNFLSNFGDRQRVQLTGRRIKASVLFMPAN